MKQWTILRITMHLYSIKHPIIKIIAISSKSDNGRRNHSEKNINRPDYVSCNAFERRLAVFLSSRNTSKVFSRTVHLSPFLPLLQKRVHASARCNTVEHPRWLTVHVGSCIITVKRFYTFTISVKFSSFHNSI